MCIRDSLLSSRTVTPPMVTESVHVEVAVSAGAGSSSEDGIACRRGLDRDDGSRTRVTDVELLGGVRHHDAVIDAENVIGVSVDLDVDGGSPGSELDRAISVDHSSDVRVTRHLHGENCLLYTSPSPRDS